MCTRAGTTLHQRRVVCTTDSQRLSQARCQHRQHVATGVHGDRDPSTHRDLDGFSSCLSFALQNLRCCTGASSTRLIRTLAFPAI